MKSMKYLALSLSFVFISFLANAQGEPGQQLNEPNYFQNNDNNDALRIAGERLIKHSRQYYLGLGLLGGGYVLSAAAFTTGNEELLTLGALAAIGGIVVQIISHRQIGKAGHMLKRASYAHNLKIQGSSTGTGLALAFHF